MKAAPLKKDALFSIIDLGGLIQSAEDLPKVLKFLAEKICLIMQADACSLFLYDAKNETLILKATHGLNQSMVDNLSLSPNQGLTGKTIKILKPISMSKVRRSPDFFYIEGFGDDEFSSFLSVPLVYNGAPIGVIDVHKKSSMGFDKDDVQFLMTLGVPAVSLIEKAKFMGAVEPVSAKTTAQQPNANRESTLTIQYLKDHFIKGLPAVPGISMGRLKIIKRKQNTTTFDDSKSSLQNEIKKLNDAFETVRMQIQETKEQAEQKFGRDEASIFEAYLLFLESNSFKQQIIDEIQKKQGVLDALNIVVTSYMDRMSQAHDEYIKERSYDIQDVARKISDHLMYGNQPIKDLFQVTEDTVFLNEFWSVSDFVELDLQKTKGIISPQGGANSHISILSDALNLPCVLGLGPSYRQLKDGDYVIVDGHSGVVIVNPSKITIDIYKNEIQELKKRNRSFEIRKHQRVKFGAKTKRFLPIGANLGMVAHVKTALESGADNIGLYRTEFPFLVRKTLPTEEDQFLIYKRTLELMKGKEVVFRTLDIGGDKYIPYLNLPKETNPALGWRGIRFSLERKDLFRIQLRALLRASQHGKISILLPMISSLDQVIEAQEIITSIKQELIEEKYKIARKIPVGVMIELPAAVEISPLLAKHVDFFSIGTNDLLQYTLGVDRTNRVVADLYDPFHPSILKMLQRTVASAHKAGIPVSVCGDMASNELLSCILIGLGIDSLSMVPRSVPKIKSLVRKLKEPDLIKLSKKCLQADCGKKMRAVIEDFFVDNDLDLYIPKGVSPLTGDKP